MAFSRFVVFILSVSFLPIDSTLVFKWINGLISGRFASGCKYCSTISLPVGNAFMSGDSQPCCSRRARAALSMLYCQGENNRTWPHVRMFDPIFLQLLIR